MPTAAQTPSREAAKSAAAAESSSVVPGTRNRVTPATRARSSCASASSPICRWQWESASKLLDLAAGRHFRGHVEEDGRARLADRCGEDHPVRLDAHQLRGLQVRDDDDVAADELLRLVLGRDA